MQIKSQSSVCDLRIGPQKNLSVLQAVGTRRAGRLDTKEWEMQDTWNQNLPKLSKDMLMFAIGEKPFELKAEPTSCRKSKVLSLIHCGFTAVNFFPWWGI